MDLAAQYGRQHRWRAWEQAYDALPPLAGARVLDLGCAIGDQASDLTARGAQVTGIDADEGFVTLARSRSIPGAAFHVGDIRQPPVTGPFDGIWGSFVAAYFPDFGPVLAAWRALLRPGGWIALTEVAGLFAHDPLAPGARELLEDYAREAREQGRYDFDMGSRLATHLAAAGFTVEADRVLPDRELAFDGPADADVLAAWAARFARMRGLQEAARLRHPSLQEDFLACLASPQHSTRCRVHHCLARRA